MASLSSGAARAREARQAGTLIASRAWPVGPGPAAARSAVGLAALSPAATIGGWLVVEALQPPSCSRNPGPTEAQALVVTEAIGAGGVDAMILSSAGSWR
jgi:hypothetical protein